jgi:hypothetical protein
MTESNVNRPAYAAARVAVSAVVALTAGCTSSTDAGSADPMTSAASTATTTSSSPAEAARQQATVVYIGMWRSYADAANTSEWRSPKLAEFATGTALATMTRGLRADHDRGVVSRGHPVNNPTVTSVEPVGSPVRVVISDCGDSTNWTQQRADNGQPVTGEPGGRRRIKAIVEKQTDGSWKVSDFGVQEVGTC